MSVLKHLKTLQHVSIIIQIIFRELVGFLLKSCYFEKEPTSSLKMIWMMIETYWSVFKCFNTDILDYYIIVYRIALVGM
jgi:hypothetical protein